MDRPPGRKKSGRCREVAVVGRRPGSGEAAQLSFLNKVLNPREVPPLGPFGDTSSNGYSTNPNV